MIVSLEGWAGCHGHQFGQLEITCFRACAETSEKDTGLERKKTGLKCQQQAKVADVSSLVESSAVRVIFSLDKVEKSSEYMIERGEISPL